MSTVSIVIFARLGAAALRETLHELRETAGYPHEVVVLASQCDEQLAIYLSREYFRRNIAGYVLDRATDDELHCRIDRAFHLVEGDYVVRLDDSLSFTQDWLATVVATLEDDPGIGWLSLLEPPPAKRPRGRPRKPSGKPVPLDVASGRCYVLRRDLLVRHSDALRGGLVGECCPLQPVLQRAGARIALLAGLVRPRTLTAGVSAAGAPAEDDLPPHEGVTGAMRRLRQPFELGDDVLMPCMACGATELEVLAARLKFCAVHQVAVGYLYEFRCPECRELHYRDWLQFGCPDAR